MISKHTVLGARNDGLEEEEEEWEETAKREQDVETHSWSFS